MSAVRFGRVFRAFVSVFLWMLAAIGLVCAATWTGTALGLIQPLVVVSGSMSPGIHVGDLLVATPTPAREVAVGAVATLPSALTGTLITHRVVSSDSADGHVVLRMKGDANDVEDAEDYLVDAESTIWTPTARIPLLGYAVAALGTPTTSVPLSIGIIALAALSALPVRSRLTAVASQHS